MIPLCCFEREYSGNSTKQFMWIVLPPNPHYIFDFLLGLMIILWVNTTIEFFNVLLHGIEKVSFYLYFFSGVRISCQNFPVDIIQGYRARKREFRGAINILPSPNDICRRGIYILKTYDLRGRHEIFSSN